MIPNSSTLMKLSVYVLITTIDDKDRYLLELNAWVLLLEKVSEVRGKIFLIKNKAYSGDDEIFYCTLMELLYVKHRERNC